MLHTNTWPATRANGAHRCRAHQPACACLASQDPSKGCLEVKQKCFACSHSIGLSYVGFPNILFFVILHLGTGRDILEVKVDNAGFDPVKQVPWRCRSIAPFQKGQQFLQSPFWAAIWKAQRSFPAAPVAASTVGVTSLHL